MIRLVYCMGVVAVLGCGVSEVKTIHSSSSAPSAPISSTAPSGQAKSEPVPSSEGQWLAQSAVMSGSPFPDEVTKSIRLVVTGNNYEVNVGGEKGKGTCEVDLSTSPSRMTIIGTEGPNAGKKMLAIFEFPKEDELRVCYDVKGVDFPKAFESTPENSYFLVSYKKESESKTQDE